MTPSSTSASSIAIRRASRQDVQAIAELAVLMWDEHTTDELAEEFSGILADRDGAAVFLAFADAEGPSPNAARQPIAFAQCQLRSDYVEGTSSSPVGYLEGIFVREQFRHRGIARQLLASCERWAASRGCTEFASDCELGNEGSLAFHLGVGFSEANRIICFTKRLA